MASDNEYLDSIVRQVVADAPKIDASVKNLMAIMMTDTSSSNSIPPNSVMTCARSLLKVIQSLDLKEVDEFVIENPQGAAQTANDRLTQMCRYKVILAYRKSCLQKGQKISRNFGRLYLLWSLAWPSIRSQAYDNMVNLTVPEEQAEIFLQRYANSIFKAEDGVYDADLIWAIDFSKALGERQARRAEGVRNRINDIVKGVVESKEDDGDCEDNQDSSI